MEETERKHLPKMKEAVKIRLDINYNFAFYASFRSEKEKLGWGIFSEKPYGFIERGGFEIGYR